MTQKIIGLALTSLFVFSCQSNGTREPSSTTAIKAGQYLNCPDQKYTLTFSENFKQDVVQSVEINPGTGDIMLANLEFKPYKGKKLATARVSDCPEEKTQCWQMDIYFDGVNIGPKGTVQAHFVNMSNGKTYPAAAATCSIKNAVAE